MTLTASTPSRRMSQWYRRLTSWAVWLTAAVVLMSLFPLFQNAAITATGYELQRLRVKRADLQQVTYLLEADIARLQSLDRVDREARERLNMTPAESIRYLQTPYAPARIKDSRVLPPSHVKLHEQPEPPPALSLTVLPADLVAWITAPR